MSRHAGLSGRADLERGVSPTNDSQSEECSSHYYQILQQYRGGDRMIELEAFDMELKTASEVKELPLRHLRPDDTFTTSRDVH